ncbi:MAG: PilN domain-containing protein [Candidatus Cloacimonetes bacterium]|nr:PilN domain-containing protein [Candidatus Cloacimonadota bacterium]
MIAKKLNIGFLKKKVIEDYFYSTTLVVLQSSFQVMCVRKLWGKVVVLWKENSFFISEGDQERVDQITHYLHEKFEKNQIMGSEISITWYPGTVIYKSLVYPKTNIDIVIKSVNLALIELFQLNYRQLCFSYQLTEKESTIDALVIATENTSISLLDKLELRDPFRITRISSLVSSVIKLYQYSEFYSEDDPAIIILEIENQLQIFLVRGNQLLNQHEEPSCFLDFNQGFETFEWAIFLKGKFKSLFFHSLGQEFPQKVDVKNIFYLTSQKFMMSASLEISKQFDLSQRSLTLKKDLIKDKKMFKTPIDLLQFGLSMQSYTSVVGENNFVRPGDFQFLHPKIHKVFLKHLFVLLFFLLLLLNLWFFSKEFHYENQVKNLSKRVLGESTRIELIEKEYKRILYVKDRLKRVQVILNSKIHPTYWYWMVSKYLQKNTFLKEIKVSSNRVDLSGESTSQAEISQLLKGLSNEAEVSGIQLDQIVKNDNGNFSFHLGFYWNKKGS